MADGGFRGEAATVIPFRRKEADSAKKKLFNKRLSSIRWKIEKLFRRVKVFSSNLTLIALYNMDVVKHPLKNVELLFSPISKSL